MVLRDTYIISILRCSALLLLMTAGSCRQSSEKTEATPAAETAAVPARSPITDQVQRLKVELQSVMTEMNQLRLQAESMRTEQTEKGEARMEKLESAYENSCITIGEMLVLQGTLKAIEERYDQGMLDVKQAQEMFNKLRIDLQSYKQDIKNNQASLRSVAGAAKK
ncbi:MAG: hypothetical protein IT262_16125 [Saprospiraceae bacterium]|nr:hypothetical protein [Saprospiraceae bacterium]